MQPIGKIYSFSFKPSKFLIGLLLVSFLLFALRIDILQLFGNYLISEDKLPDSSKAIVVLSGGALERANEAARIAKMLDYNKIICVGGNLSNDLKVIGLNVFESDLTKKQLLLNGIDSSKIICLYAGTSTREEATIISQYCKNNHIDSIVIVSGKFHTRRVRQVYKKQLNNSTIFSIHGAPSTLYNEQEWWKNENGLIALQNEYIKIIYYIFK